jgi:hypothetical protein
MTSPGCTCRSYFPPECRREEDVVYGSLLSVTSPSDRATAETPNSQTRRPPARRHSWYHPMRDDGHGSKQASTSLRPRPSTASAWLRSQRAAAPPPLVPAPPSRPCSALRSRAHPRARPGSAPPSLLVMGTPRGADCPQAFRVARDAAEPMELPADGYHAAAITACAVRDAAAWHALAAPSPRADAGVHTPHPVGPPASFSSLRTAPAAPPPGLFISSCGEPRLMSASPRSMPIYAPSVKRRVPGIRHASHAPADQGCTDVCLIAGREGTSILCSAHVQRSAGRGRANTPRALSRPGAPHCVGTGGGGYRFGSC